MSSSVGIGLEAATPAGRRPARFCWTASVGSFVLWGPPSFRVEPRGPTVVGNVSDLHWTFAPGSDVPGHDVVVTLDAEDPRTGDVLGRATRVIGREEGEVANVVSCEPVRGTCVAGAT